MDSLNDLNKKEITQWLLNSIQTGDNYIHRNGIRITHISEDRTEGTAEITPDVFNPMKMAHGGFLFTLADTVSGVAAWAGAGKSFVTQSSTVYFLRPVGEGLVHAIAKPIKIGRQTCVCSVEIYDASSTMVFYATFTFFQKDTPLPTETTKLQ
ncbi:MAG: PaaI family thioesterase [Oscillospiraceae bacterium]|nr:PaaI family thioesterase [Oscillospiraceae bacterium]